MFFFIGEIIRTVSSDIIFFDVVVERDSCVCGIIPVEKRNSASTIEIIQVFFLRFKYFVFFKASNLFVG